MSLPRPGGFPEEKKTNAFGGFPPSGSSPYGAGGSSEGMTPVSYDAGPGVGVPRRYGGNAFGQGGVTGQGSQGFGGSSASNFGDEVSLGENGRGMGRNQFGTGGSGPFQAAPIGRGAASVGGTGIVQQAGQGFGMSGGDGFQKSPSSLPSQQQPPPPSEQQQGQPTLDWQQWAPEGVNAQMLNMGGNAAKSFFQSNVAQYQPRVTGMWHTLKAYFAVSNTYVLHKMKVLLLPVVKKDWFRSILDDQRRDDGKVSYARPQEDVNAPDLYIPLMAFITFVLVTGYAKGVAGTKSDSRKFTPEALTDVTSSCVVAQILEVLAIRLGLYLLQSPAVVLDLVSYTGYKYVGLCINMSLGIWAGMTAYYLSLLWMGTMTSYFMFKTMAHVVPTTGATSSREIVILGCGAIQFLSMWWLGHTRDLS